MTNKLQEVLNKLAKQEHWRKKPKLKGRLIKKTKTKSGNLKMIIKKRDEHVVYVLKKNTKLYEKAEKAEEGNLIFIVGRIWLGKMFCEKIDVLGRVNRKYFKDEKQIKLNEI